MSIMTIVLVDEQEGDPCTSSVRRRQPVSSTVRRSCAPSGRVAS